MVWLYPKFLWALFALAIPILIHLFHFRRYKKIIFPNLRFLKQIDQETRSGSKLKKYLILASRLLAIAFLVFAFSQPVLTGDKKRSPGGRKHISIILDNSYSMNLGAEEGPLLEAAKNRARAIVKSGSSSDLYNIVSADMDASLLHFASRDVVLEQIDKIKICNNSRPLKSLLDLQNSSLKNKNGGRMAFCISDFQKNQIQGLQTDTSYPHTWIRIPSENRENLSIDSAWLYSPIIQKGQTITLQARISNHTASGLEGGTLELWADGKPKGVAALNIAAGASAETEISFTLENAGRHRCELRLPGDLIPSDDVLYFSVRISEQYRVGCISKNPEKYVQAVFSEDAGYVFTPENSGSVGFSEFGKRDLIVLQGAGELTSGLVSELSKFVRNGGTAMVFPDKELSAGGLGELQSAFGFSVSPETITEAVKIGRIDLEHPLLQPVFSKRPEKPELPVVSRYFRMNAPGAVSVMQLLNGNPFLLDLEAGRGHLLLCAVAIDPSFSNLQDHALFVPLLLRSAMLARYRSPLYFDCADAGDIYSGLPFEGEKSILLQGNKTAVIPELMNRNGELWLNTHGEISEPGHYALKLKDSDSIAGDLSFNISRIESDTRSLNPSEFEALCGELGVSAYQGNSETLASGLSKEQRGIPLWKWCILFSLLCLMIEILLIRFFRNHVRLSA